MNIIFLNKKRKDKSKVYTWKAIDPPPSGLLPEIYCPLQLLAYFVEYSLKEGFGVISLEQTDAAKQLQHKRSLKNENGKFLEDSLCIPFTDCYTRPQCLQ